MRILLLFINNTVIQFFFSNVQHHFYYKLLNKIVDLFKNIYLSKLKFIQVVFLLLKNNI